MPGSISTVIRDSTRRRDDQISRRRPGPGRLPWPIVSIAGGQLRQWGVGLALVRSKRHGLTERVYSIVASPPRANARGSHSPHATDCSDSKCWYWRGSGKSCPLKLHVSRVVIWPAAERLTCAVPSWLIVRLMSPMRLLIANLSERLGPGFGSGIPRWLISSEALSDFCSKHERRSDTEAATRYSLPTSLRSTRFGFKPLGQKPGVTLCGVVLRYGDGPVCRWPDQLSGHVSDLPESPLALRRGEPGDLRWDRSYRTNARMATVFLDRWNRSRRRP